MLHCEYCDYLRKIPDNTELNDNEKFICEFTNFIFTKDFLHLDIEYPCSQS